VVCSLWLSISQRNGIDDVYKYSILVICLLFDVCCLLFDVLWVIKMLI
jgi:hypothetical protein